MKEVWARLRYHRMTVSSFDPEKGVIRVEPDFEEESGEPIFLPAQLLEIYSNLSLEYKPPDLKNMILWNNTSYRVHTIEDEVGYVYYIPDNFTDTGIYFLVPATEFYSSEGTGWIDKLESFNFSGQDVLLQTGTLVRRAPYTFNKIVTGITIQGWVISGPVSGAIRQSYNKTEVLSPKELIDTDKIPDNLKASAMIIAFDYLGLDLLIEARHITIFYK